MQEVIIAALACVAQLVGAPSHKPKECGFYPQLRGAQEATNQCFSHTNVSLPRSLSLKLKKKEL